MEVKKRKGQIKLNMVINLPASALQNNTSPTHCPVIRKPAVHRMPKRRHPKIVPPMVRLIFTVSFLLSASAIMGRSITETELEKTVGNMTMDKAIPVKTPYMLRASLLV